MLFNLYGILAMMSTDSNLSHAERLPLEGSLKVIAERIEERGELPYITVARQLELLDELSSFSLGRFLIQRGGLNGFWTDYIIKHPEQGRLTGINSDHVPFSDLERFLLDQAPTCLATQQRFQIFKQEIQNRLHPGMALASIPCGLTADLLDLDYADAPDCVIYGLDIDQVSLTLSEERAKGRGHFLPRDAWNLEFHETFDLITSNGLSIYEPDDEKVVALYKEFWKALKPNGYLVTSFLTPPAAWDISQVNPQHALLQKIIFADILATKWQKFRTEELVKSQLAEAGFTVIEIHYDQAHIFPTIIAQKRSLNS